MTTVADLTVGPPGKPDQPASSAPSSPRGRSVEHVPVEPEDVLPAGPPPVSHESVKGLVLGAANILHQVLASRYEERPEIAVMTDDEAERIAGALVSMASRNDGLRQILERSDAATLAIVLAGYSGRIVTDVREAKKERQQRDRSTAAQGGRGPGPAAPHGTPVGRFPGQPGDGGGHGGGVPPADGRGLAVQGR